MIGTMLWHCCGTFVRHTIAPPLFYRHALVWRREGWFYRRIFILSNCQRQPIDNRIDQLGSAHNNHYAMVLVSAEDQSAEEHPTLAHYALKAEEEVR